MKKRILKSLLARHLPEYDIEQPKRGFAVPINEWLKTDLKDWAQDAATCLQCVHTGRSHEPERVVHGANVHLQGSRETQILLSSVGFVNCA